MSEIAGPSPRDCHAECSSTWLTTTPRTANAAGLCLAHRGEPLRHAAAKPGQAEPFLKRTFFRFSRVHRTVLNIFRLQGARTGG